MHLHGWPDFRLGDKCVQYVPFKVKSSGTLSKLALKYTP